jgi:ComEC/Rec2-related protein
MQRWAIYLAIALVGFTIFHVRYSQGVEAMKSDEVMSALESGETFSTTFRILDDPVVAHYRASLIGKDSHLGHRMIVASTPDTLNTLSSVRVGDTVTVTGYLVSLSEYQQYRQHEHIIGEFTAQSVRNHSPSTSLLDNSIHRLRERITQGCEQLDTPYRGTCEGLLIGERANIDNKTYAQFKDAQLTHLIVASGANIAFILAFCAPLISRLNYTSRNLAMIAIAVLYCCLTRFEPSMLRATAMVVIPSLCAIRGFQLSQRTVLLSTVGACLIIDPFLVHRVGFWLSVSAVSGLIVLAPIINKNIRSPLVSQTLGATLAVQPVLWLVFGLAVPWKWWVSVIAIAIAAPLTTLGFVVIVLMSFLSPRSMVSNVAADVYGWGVEALHLTAQAGATSVSSYAGILMSIALAVGYTRSVHRKRKLGSHNGQSIISRHIYRWR